MTHAAEPKFDAQLAWDLQDWNEGQLDGQPMNRDQVKRLAEYLSTLGYTKGKPAGLGGLLSTFEEVGAKLADEFGPVIDQFRKPK